MTYHELPTTQMHRGDNSGFVLGLIAGAAVGGGLALLFAPNEGAQTRHGLAAGAQQAGRRVSEAYGSLAGSARRNVRRFSNYTRGGAASAADTTSNSLSTDSHYERARPAGDVIRDAVGEAIYTPASTPNMSAGPGVTTPAPDRSPLV